MSSSDDSTDKALKEHFQRIFEDFERTPPRSLKKQIWKQLPVGSTPPYRYVVVAVLLLLLIGGALYGPQRILTRPAFYAQPNRLVRGQSHAGSFRSQPRSAIHPDQSASGIAGLVTNQPDGSSIQVALRSQTRPDGSALDTKSALPRQPVRLAARVGRSVPAVNQALLFPAVDQGNQLTDRQPVPHTENEANPLVQTPVRALWAATAADSLIGRENVLATLQPVAIRQFGVPTYTVTRLLVQLPQQPTEVATEHQRAPLHWLASVSPLSTYQLMTIAVKPETYVQRVDAPAAFSAPTWGYQVSGGLVWRQFAVQLMAGQLRRWAYYDVATNEYRIEPTGPTEYRITRLSRSVVENSSLTMLGASLAKEYTLSKRPGRYVARLGGQGTYLPATGQTLLWGQAALTMGIPLKTAYSVQVGPTIQYGFSRLFSDDRQLVIHPFQVGVSLTIRPTAQSRSRSN